MTARVTRKACRSVRCGSQRSAVRYQGSGEALNVVDKVERMAFPTIPVRCCSVLAGVRLANAAR